MPSHETTEIQFGHSVQPKSVGHKSGRKYRSDGLENAPLTLMSDPRVVRGNTQAMARKVAATKAGSFGERGGQVVYDGGSAQQEAVQLPMPSYAYDVRSHVAPDLDLSPYLVVKDEELGVRKKEVDSQTNEFQARPPTPEYVPRKTGVDRSTQITRDEAAKLFDFDREVEPILEVIVSKTLEQALFEVEAEEELLSLEKAARQFHVDKAAEMAWCRERELENINEKKAQEELIRTREAEKQEEWRVKTVIGAVQAMGQLVPGIFEAAVEQLYASKVWRRPEVAGVEDHVLAKTTANMKARLKAYTAAQTLIDEIVLDAQTLYERAPLWFESPLPRQATLTVELREEEGESTAPSDDGAERVVAKKRTLGPVRIADRFSVTDVLAQLRQEAREREIPLEISLAMLLSFFSTIIGQTISVDGAIMNFEHRIPDEMTMLL